MAKGFNEGGNSPWLLEVIAVINAVLRCTKTSSGVQPSIAVSTKNDKVKSIKKGKPALNHGFHSHTRHISLESPMS